MDQPNLTRRQVVLGLLGVGAVGAAGAALKFGPLSALLDAAEHAGAAGTGGNVLVVITLAGGNDGLNTVVPYTNSAYLGARDGMHFAANEVLPIGDGIGLHPELTGLKALWDAGSLAIVQGVGYPQPNRSHFRSMDIWQSGVPDRQEATGWLGRWLDTQSANPIHAVTLGNEVPLLLTGTRRRAAAIPTAGITVPSTYRGAYGDLGRAAAASGTWETAYRQAMQDVVTIERNLRNVLPVRSAGSTASNAPSTTAQSGMAVRRQRVGLASQLDAVRAMLQAGLSTSVFHVTYAGFDTHATEKDRHAELMSELGDAIAGFVRDAKSLTRPVTVVAYSEFGRRLALNASNGTDHGTAGPVFVAGSRVRGGLYGEASSLTNLDDGDLKYTTDFRAVFGTLTARVLQQDPARIIGGPQRDLGFIT